MERFQILTREEMEQRKYELLYSLLYRGRRIHSDTHHVRDIVNDPIVWLSWRKANIGVFLWLGRMYYKERKTAFIEIDHGAANYRN